MKVTTINSIEITSICNNKCAYCPAKDQHKYREVGHMELKTFETALEAVLMFSRHGTQRELNLFGVGEPTLHPQLLEFVKLARKVLPFKQIIHLNTNGRTMTKDLAYKLKQAGMTSMDVTVHDGYHREAAKTIRIFSELSISFRVSIDPVIMPNNWAGQVEWFPPKYESPCPWIGRGQVMIMSNGDITRCCIDAFATGVMGNILRDNIQLMDVTSFALCSKCHHTTPSSILQG